MYLRLHWCTAVQIQRPDKTPKLRPNHQSCALCTLGLYGPLSICVCLSLHVCESLFDMFVFLICIEGTFLEM